MSDAPHIMIVEARFYTDIADEMLKGALAAVKAAGGSYEKFSVPGAFEVPAAVQFAVEAQKRDPNRKKFDGYVGLGCVIRGETTHYDYVCTESARGLQDLALRHNIAIGYGILTVENEDQAWARARVTEGDKGGTVTRACIEMIKMKRQFGLPVL
ncbi:MAG TPA: 6,7-dimethyl-8-ribityllumazine synthase [Alphaproteobacteria bacterium]|nr:6,7-dimethyl-8-ribityllumazine synthase [Alphaproteobacteria bacterium]